MMKLIQNILLLSFLSTQSVFAMDEKIDEQVKKQSSNDKVVEKNAALEKNQDKDNNHLLTTTDLLDMLVSGGVLTEDKASDLLQEMMVKKSTKDIAKNKAAEEASTIDPKIVRVPYVPDFIKHQIRDDVRMGLREEVISDIIVQARNQRWGVPGALPTWVSRIKFKGDFRLRYQGDFFADNLPDGSFTTNLYRDPSAVNQIGNIDDISSLENISVDRIRLRQRFRLSMNAKVTEGFKVGLRLASGKFNNPVSTNQTLGNSFQANRIVLDRAYIKIQAVYNEWTFWGGRMPNPWMSTNLIWDKDLNFDGLAFKYRPLQSDDLDNDERIFDTSATVGIFPISEVALSSKDKWLFGFQLAFNWKFIDQDRFDIGIAYYDYKNIEGSVNAADSFINDFTAPDSMQSGNTLFNIANPIDPAATDQLWALASDYNLVNLLMAYKIANFAPINVEIKADYVKNIGYDNGDVLQRTGNQFVTPRACIDASCTQLDSSAKVTGYQFMLKVGWPSLKQRGNWDMSMAYRYLERDAVLDAFTDSDFRKGGTDSKGWWINGRYAVDDNTWMSLKLISADEIDGPAYGVDTVQLDLIASF